MARLVWLLLAHAFLPPAPYGSWAARGRADPAGGWRMPPPIFCVAWVVLALGYTYSGYTKLVSPSWQDGTALARVLNNPLARPGPVREVLLALPAGLLRVATWGDHQTSHRLLDQVSSHLAYVLPATPPTALTPRPTGIVPAVGPVEELIDALRAAR